MWVQAWNIPVQWLSSKTAWKIEKIFNQCSNVIVPESGSKEGLHARILVEVELTKLLIRGIKICFEGEKHWVIFKYEQLPYFCFYCVILGHGKRLCTKKMKDAKNACLNEGQFAEWLRATTRRMGSVGKVKDRIDLVQSLGTKQKGKEHERELKK